jgi:hypothetical protein
MLSRPTSAEDRLAVLAQRGSRSWASVASILDEVDESEHWRASASSFSQFVRRVAYSMGLGEGSLWRYLTAYRYLEQLRATLVGRGIECQSVEDLSKIISPESVELFSKIARAAPDDVLERLARRLVSGQVTRAELRDSWVAFRPVVEGTSARGRGAAVPRITNPTKAQVSRQLHASVTNALIRSGGTWLGCALPTAFGVMADVRPFSKEPRKAAPEFDAVAMLQRDARQPVEVHGLEIFVVGPEDLPFAARRISESLEQREPYVDRLWLAQHHEQAFVGPSHVPEYVGLIVATDEGIDVQRPASETPSKALHAEALLRSVLPWALRR